MHVDGILVQQHGHGIPIHFANDPMMRRIGDVNNHKVFTGGGTQGNFRCREILGRPVIPTVHMAENAAVRQVFQQFLTARRIAEGFSILKGKLESGALEVAQEDVKVVRVQQCIFRRLAQEVIRMGHDVLINGCRGSYIKNNAGILSAACTSGLLPRTGNSAGIAAHDAGIQSTNVNAQLQRIGGYHRINLPCTETTLNLPSFCGQVAAPIAPHPTGIS